MNKIIETKTFTNTLPGYRNPPINEVVCGMRFHTPEKLRIPHIGILWDKFRDEYPVIQHSHPIAGPQGDIPLDYVLGLPLPRIWFINKSDDQLIQFQFDRFYFNWRRRQNIYPRYSYIIENFEKLLETIESFFNELELGKLNPVEYELSYINHLLKGKEWDKIDDLQKIFTDFNWKQTQKRFLPNPDNVAWQITFTLPDNKGNLYCNLKKAIRAEDKLPLFVFELSARGFNEPINKASIRQWFDLAREWIVRGFTDLTTYEIQKFWGRE
jgi:uncharacterized protein (TIGR04255 family)